ncbi:MAG: hypothetical protein JW751_07925 [Polyangiaceae bacterium]|nr:hypothetical protein [Polyangiaceae bacterium]
MTNAAPRHLLLRVARCRPDAPRPMPVGAALLAVVAVTTATAASCRCEQTPPTSASASASIASSAPGDPTPKPYLPPPVVPRVGPVLAIVPGEAVGPIYFGATVATVERHMQRACDVKTDKVCRYFGEALEFFFTEGVLSEIRVHGLGRPAGKDSGGTERKYGNFNGAVDADPAAGRPLVTTFGMHAEGAAAGLGKPKRIEPLDGQGPFHTVAVHHYDGLLVEYDRISDARMPVVNGFRVIRRGP